MTNDAKGADAKSNFALDLGIDAKSNFALSLGQISPEKVSGFLSLLLDMGDQQLVPRMQEALGVQTRAELAACLGASRGAVDGWSRRGAVPLRWLRRCRKFSGCSAHWLVYGVEQQEAPHASAEAEARAWFGPLFEAFHASPEPSPSAKPLRP